MRTKFAITTRWAAGTDANLLPICFSFRSELDALYELVDGLRTAAVPARG